MTTSSSQVPGPKLEDSWVLVEEPPQPKSQKEENYHSLLNNTQKAIEEHQKGYSSDCWVSVEEGKPDLQKKSQPLNFQKSIFEAIGTRYEMQDAHFFHVFESGILLGVFDGHGKKGKKVASLAAKMFKELFPKKLEEEGVVSAFKTVFSLINEKIFEDKTFNWSGTTAVCCYIDRENRVFTATIGDSEANIYRKFPGRIPFFGKWKSIPISCVRHWKSPNDWKRLVNYHGQKKADEYKNMHEKNIYSGLDKGGLNCSRVLGDFADRGTKEKPLIISKHKLTVNRLQEGDWLILACDGLKDFLCENKIVHRIASLKQEEDCAKVLGTAAIENMRNGWGDNVTIIALRFFSGYSISQRILSTLKGNIQIVRDYFSKTKSKES